MCWRVTTMFMRNLHIFCFDYRCFLISSINISNLLSRLVLTSVKFKCSEVKISFSFSNLYVSSLKLFSFSRSWFCSQNCLTTNTSYVIWWEKNPTICASLLPNFISDFVWNWFCFMHLTNTSTCSTHILSVE